MNPVYTLHRGTRPLLVSVPHDGTELPNEIAARMTDEGRAVPDTDWHIARLYDFVRARGASLIVPRYSRYVVDLNRPVDGSALYPGRRETGVCPTISFADRPLYRPDQAPGADEIAWRVDRYWRPYHAALAAELERLRSEHPAVLLWEGHSIRGRVPMLFDGRLPDLNLGTASGASCAAVVRTALAERLGAQTRYSHVVDGRFQGGYITRHYGRPEQGIHAVQLELVQANYMDEDPPYTYRVERAEPLIGLIGDLLDTALAALPR